MAGQKGEQLVLPLGQVNGPVLLADLIVVRVDGQPAAGAHGPAGVRRSRLLHGRAADVGLDPGHQLPHGEGLGDVVVRPDLQALDLVRLLLPGGEDDDGHAAALLPENAAHIKADHLRQHHVQQHDVRVLLQGHGEPRLPVVGGEDGIALLLQVKADDIHNALLVLHDQYGLFLFHSGPLFRLRRPLTDSAAASP